MFWIGLMIGFYIFTRMMELKQLQRGNKEMTYAVAITQIVVAFSLFMLIINQISSL